LLELPDVSRATGRVEMSLGMAKLRELAAELGYWPATTDEADIERHRQHNASADYWLARRHRFDHLRRAAERRKQAAG
jgi:hypothetical protein